MTENAQRAVELIRDKVGVRWPAGHVEIALIQLQRRRQHRRVVRVGATLGVGGLAVLVALGAGSRVLQSVAPRRLAAPAPIASTAGLSAARSAPGATVSSKPAGEPVVVAFGPSVPVGAGRGTAAGPLASPPPREGHLLQQRLVPRRQVAAGRWVALAGKKRFGEAYGLLRQVPMRELAEPDDLLLAADVARQAGRPERAVPFLERVVKEHPHELCAQLAGFSLGKIYLDGMDEPALAARNFAAVRAMAPTGGLAQDALAREVEAWARAGESARARAAATEYLRLYPMGRRLAAVRDLGGI